ncbi:UNVERIFIED_CONTAM: hypothetical protein HDU68_006499 [Siphonaria sp. JEL0065]|nr:hypothetical protein HDU68_006499 [Siphonaria sp. JEL0065]
MSHMEEITRLLKENDKLKHLVKHYKSNSASLKQEEQEGLLRRENMPELFKTVFKTISSGGSSGVYANSEPFKKAVGTLKRLVGRLLDLSSDDAVREAIRSTTIVAPPKKPNHSSSSRYKSPSTTTRKQPSHKRDPAPTTTTATYKPLKSRPIGLTSPQQSYSPRNNTSNSRVHSRSASVNSATSSRHGKRFDPTSYILEKELKMLARRQQSRDSLNASMSSNQHYAGSRNASLSRGGKGGGLEYPRSNSVGSAGYRGVAGVGGSGSGGNTLKKGSRNASVESRGSRVGGGGLVGVSTAAYKLETKLKGGVGSKRDTMLASKESWGAGGGGGMARESEDDIDKRLEFLQQYLNTLNNS